MKFCDAPSPYKTHEFVKEPNFPGGNPPSPVKQLNLACDAPSPYKTIEFVKELNFPGGNPPPPIKQLNLACAGVSRRL